MSQERLALAAFIPYRLRSTLITVHATVTFKSYWTVSCLPLSLTIYPKEYKIVYAKTFKEEKYYSLCYTCCWHINLWLHFLCENNALELTCNYAGYVPFYLHDAAINAAVVIGGMAGYSWS